MKRMLLTIASFLAINGMRAEELEVKESFKTKGALPEVGLHIPFPKDFGRVYKRPDYGHLNLPIAPGQYIPPQTVSFYAGGRWIEPYVIQAKGKPYVYVGEEVLAQPKLGQEAHEMLEVLIRRNHLLQKSGLNPDALSSQEKADLAKILEVYPIVQI